MMSLQSDDFELFGLKRQFQQDAAELELRWKSLQRQAHPDKFAAHDASAQRLAMQWSARINEAYRRLKDPIRRSAYLCELQGNPINAESNTAMPGAFLMQQLHWREALDEARDENAVLALQAEVESALAQELGRVARAIDVERQFDQAVLGVRALMFIERFLQDVARRLDHMET